GGGPDHRHRVQRRRIRVDPAAAASTIRRADGLGRHPYTGLRRVRTIGRSRGFRRHGSPRLPPGAGAGREYRSSVADRGPAVGHAPLGGAVTHEWSTTELTEMYRTMVLIRTFEERII